MYLSILCFYSLLSNTADILYKICYLNYNKLLVIYEFRQASATSSHFVYSDQLSVLVHDLPYLMDLVITLTDGHCESS